DYDVAVAAYHEGASGDGASGEAPANTDPIFDKIVDETSAEVDAIFNGDSHQTYAYSAPGPTTRSGPWSRPVTTAACWARSPSSTRRPTGGAWPRTDSS